VTRIRSIAALVIIATLGLAPIAGDWCAANCEGRAAAKATSSHCHGTASSRGLRVTQLPAPCGHKHHVEAMARNIEPSRLAGSFASPPLTALSNILSDSARRRFAAPTSRAGPHADTPSIPLTLSSSLRI